MKIQRYGSGANLAVEMSLDDVQNLLTCLDTACQWYYEQKADISLGMARSYMNDLNRIIDDVIDAMIEEGKGL